MKNIDQTKNKLNTIFKRYGLILSLLFISLGYSGNAWGGEYYLLMGTNNNPSDMTSKGSRIADDEYEWTVTVQTSGNNYFGISTSASYTNLLNASSHTITCNLSSCYFGPQQYNYGGTNYNFKWFSSNQTSTVVIKYKASTTTYTLSTSGIAVATSVTGGTISPISASVASGGSQEFTVTPSTGYVVTAVSYSGSATNGWTSGNTINLSNITSAGTLTVTCGPSVPVVRMGDIPTPNPATNESVTAYAYLAKTGCANVTKLRIYIGKDESPTKSSPYVEYTTGNPYSINNEYAITIPVDSLNKIAGVDDSFTAYIKATGFNSAGESELSDELTFDYQACPIEVEITPNSGEMLLNEATEFTADATGAGDTPSYKWFVNDVEQSGEILATFDFTPTIAGSYEITVEVTGTSCSSTATANMTTCNSPAISSLTVSPATTTPWEAAIFTAIVSNTNNVQFTVTGATIVATKISDTEWEGRFKSGTVGTYVVTATATSSSGNCGTATDTENVEVEADVEVCP